MNALASQARPEDLIDLAALTRAYFELQPDMANPAQRVAFGTSGHRGSSLDGAFNERHILAITQSIVEYRAAQGITGPIFVGRDTHGLSEPAWRTTLEVLVANGVETLIDDRDGFTPTPAVSHAILRVQSGKTRAGRRPPADPVAQPAPRRRHQVQSPLGRTGRRRGHLGHRQPRQPADRRRSEGRAPHPVRARPGAAKRFDFLGRISTTCPASWTWTSSARPA
jgi:hypothetical protein